MPQIADVKCSIKVTQEPSGAIVANGAETDAGTVTVHYVVKNVGTKATGQMTVVGSLYRDGVKVQPNGAPNVVPAQQISLAAGAQFARDIKVSEAGKGLIRYSARLLGDVGDFVNESDETNNKARIDFDFLHI